MNQLGLQLRDAGIERVSAHNVDWLDTMRDYARTCCATFGAVTTDDLQSFAGRIGCLPDHPNAWGAIFKERGWRCVGRMRSERPSAHAREIKVWQWGAGQ